jgi:Domain of unknown function (DUF4410)
MRTKTFKEFHSMKPKLLKAIQVTSLAVTLALLAPGCQTASPTSSTHAAMLKPSTAANVDLSKYQIATVLPFQTQSPVDPSIGAKFANEVALRLKSDFGPIFQDVRKELPPLGTNNELIVTGTITEYKPGDKFYRAMLIGMGAASFKGNLVLKDGADGRILMDAPMSKLWAWGGALGASKGIDDMVTESQASVAATVAHAKGWQPPSQPENARTEAVKK